MDKNIQKTLRRLERKIRKILRGKKTEDRCMRRYAISTKDKNKIMVIN